MELLEAGRPQKLCDAIRAQARIAEEPALVLHSMVEQHRVRLGDAVVTEPSELEWVIGTRVAEMERMSQLVQERVVIALATVRAQHEIDFFGNPDRRAERPRTLSFSLSDVKNDSPIGGRIDAHFRDLPPHHALHLPSWKGIVVLRRSEQSERIRAFGLRWLDAKRFLEDPRQGVVPHRLRIPQKQLAARPERLERYAAHGLERSVVIARYPKRLDVFLFALKSLEPERRVLLLHELRARVVQSQPQRTISCIGDLDRCRLILDHTPIRRSNERRILP